MDAAGRLTWPYAEGVNAVSSAALKRLARLDVAALDALHATAQCPEPEDLVGVLDGAVLSGTLAANPWRRLRVWRGKELHSSGDVVRGRNRLGLGPLEFRQFSFTARRARSSFSDRDVVLLDHDEPGNPSWVRRFHDELVEVAPGIHLATSHHRTPQGLRPLAHFALVGPRG